MLPKRLNPKIWKYLAAALVGSLVATFILQHGKTSNAVSTSRDYPEISTEGTLRVALEYNSISLHLNGDTLSGFDYELIEAFAKDHGLHVSIMPEMSFEKRLEGLAIGKYDLIANGILATSTLKDSLLLTTPITLTKEVLVQRKASSPDDSLFIRTHLSLAKRTLHVVKGSPSILRIQNLGDEIADTIYIKEVEKYGPEQLIAMVAHGDINYAVCDENIARAAADSMPQIDISTDISFTQFYSWAVSKKSPALLDSLNAWLEDFKQGREYQKIYQKYYK